MVGRDWRQVTVRDLLPLSRLRQCCDSEKWRTGENSGEQWRKPTAMFATIWSVVATKSSLERATRIELAFSAWEADVLPLNYTRAALIVPPPPLWMMRRP